jgi:hypothetical protein
MKSLTPRRTRGVSAFLGVIALLLGLVGFAPTPAAAAPAADGSPSLVIYEVYAPVGADPQSYWFEVYNTQPRTQYPLNGLVIATGSKMITLKTTDVITGGGFALFTLAPDAIQRGLVRQPPPAAKVIPVPGLAPLDPSSDALALLTPDRSLVIDQVNWGKPSEAWPNFALLKEMLWSPGLDPLDAVKDKGLTWGRTPPVPASIDTNNARPPSGDWTKHATPSPGSKVPPIPQKGILGAPTDYAGAAGSLLIWASFLIVAVIAYRFERLRDTRTYWQLLLLAPSGLLFYTYIVVQAFSQGRALTYDERWQAFPPVAVTALLCLIAVGIFRNVARSLLEGE